MEKRMAIATQHNDVFQVVVLVSLVFVRIMVDLKLVYRSAYLTSKKGPR